MCMKEACKIIGEFIRKVASYLPFYISGTILRSLGKDEQSILDVGCGWGESIKIIKFKKHKFYIVGGDIFRPYIIEAKRNKIHDECVLCDARKLPFKQNSFDTVLCMEMIEHLEKSEGMKLIGEIEKIARMRVIITTPVGFMQQDSGGDGNLYKLHKSGYYPVEFRKWGYNVRGFGFRINNLLYSYPYFKNVRRVLRVGFSPFSYFFPTIGERMICVKKR